MPPLLYVEYSPTGHWKWKHSISEFESIPKRSVWEYKNENNILGQGVRGMDAVETMGNEFFGLIALR